MIIHFLTNYLHISKRKIAAADVFVIVMFRSRDFRWQNIFILLPRPLVNFFFFDLWAKRTLLWVLLSREPSESNVHIHIRITTPATCLGEGNDVFKWISRLSVIFIFKKKSDALVGIWITGKIHLSDESEDRRRTLLYNFFFLNFTCFIQIDYQNRKWVFLRHKNHQTK